MRSSIRPEILGQQKKLVVGGLLILSAAGELFNHVDQGLPMWTGEGDRKVTVDIVFLEAFTAPPHVTVGLTAVDSAHDSNLRLWITAQNVTESGFTLECSTWGNTHIARAATSWQAIGPASEAASQGASRPLVSRKAS